MYHGGATLISLVLFMNYLSVVCLCVCQTVYRKVCAVSPWMKLYGWISEEQLIISNLILFSKFGWSPMSYKWEQTSNTRIFRQTQNAPQKIIDSLQRFYANKGRTFQRNTSGHLKVCFCVCMCAHTLIFSSTMTPKGHSWKTNLQKSMLHSTFNFPNEKLY